MSLASSRTLACALPVAALMLALSACDEGSVEAEGGQSPTSDAATSARDGEARDSAASAERDGDASAMDAAGADGRDGGVRDGGVSVDARASVGAADGRASDGAADAKDAAADDAHDAASPTTCSVEPPTACPTPMPRYADVAPIFKARCAGCHGANWTGAWPLDNYRHVADWARDIRAHLLACTMPPADAGVPMTNQERMQILHWVRCDAPE